MKTADGKASRMANEVSGLGRIRTYNSWTNYETWCVNLWLTSGGGLYTASRGANLVSRKHGADALKEWVMEPDNGIIPDLGATLAADLLSAALSEVNWEEVFDYQEMFTSMGESE